METRDVSFIDYVFFVSFFPQLIAGPIVHHKEIIPQLQDKKLLRFNPANFSKGTYIFVIGLAKKLLIADSFAIWANQGYSMAETLSTTEAWGATLAYTMQLYFDFSGYSDMAIGLGLMFNFHMPVNFLSPYRSLDIKEFWRRWHATLGRFFTQYLYIPLGGNRMGEARTLLNLFIIFLVSGIWHGAGWTFIIWGVAHGIASLIHRIWSSRGFALPKGLSWLLTFLFVHFAWIFFRAETVNDAITIIRTMTSLGEINPNWHINNNGNSFLSIGEIFGSSHFITVPMPFLIVFIIIILAPSSIELLKRFRPNIITSLYMAILTALLLYFSFNSTGISEFLYFNF
jgi:alginate O-acetyltransferase complex protein AlgI